MNKLIRYITNYFPEEISQFKNLYSIFINQYIPKKYVFSDTIKHVVMIDLTNVRENTFPKNLYSLELQKFIEFNEKDKFPDNLHTLKVSSDEINGKVLPSNLHTLKCITYNSTIKLHSLPNNLNTLILQSNYVDNVSIEYPKNLHTLVFGLRGIRFNAKLLPRSLKILDMRNYYGYNVDNEKDLPEIHTLIFSMYQNSYYLTHHPPYFPKSLTSLYISIMSYNELIRMPEGLEVLAIDKCSDDIDNFFKYLQNLRILILGKDFSITIYKVELPKSLKKIVVEHGYKNEDNLKDLEKIIEVEYCDDASKYLSIELD